MNEKELIIYNKGIKEGQKHTEPSFDTSRFMEKTNLAMAEIKKDIQGICEKFVLNAEEHTEIKKSQKEVIDKIEKWMDKMETNYTPLRQFEFWRNFLFGGIVLAIISNIIDRTIN